MLAVQITNYSHCNPLLLCPLPLKRQFIIEIICCCGKFLLTRTWSNFPLILPAISLFFSIAFNYFPSSQFSHFSSQFRWLLFFIEINKISLANFPLFSSLWNISIFPLFHFAFHFAQYKSMVSSLFSSFYNTFFPKTLKTQTAWKYYPFDRNFWCPFRNYYPLIMSRINISLILTQNSILFYFDEKFSFNFIQQINLCKRTEFGSFL